MKRPQSRRQGRSIGKKASTGTATPTVDTPARLELHIEELVLHGFSGDDRFSIAATAQHELEQLLSKQAPQGIGHASLTLDKVYAGTFNVMAGTSAPAMGRRLAQTIHRGLSFNATRRGVVDKKQ
jgi:hypothetical protein